MVLLVAERAHLVSLRSLTPTRTMRRVTAGSKTLLKAPDTMSVTPLGPGTTSTMEA